MKVLLALDADRAPDLRRELEREGVEVLALVAADAPARALTTSAPDATADALANAEALVLDVTRSSVTADLVAACDRAGVRIVPLAAGADAERIAALHGMEEPRDPAIDGWRLAEDLTRRPTARAAVRAETTAGPRTIAVWGPPGAPGRTTIAVELAVELARGGRRVGLVDADSHAPGIAIALGLADEGPGFAAACRQAELGGLDARELTRIALPLGRTGVEVLTGINRPSRWPELSASRVSGALSVCRGWVDHVVVDVAASLETDEEIVSDLDGPRRNAATIAAVQSADLVVAVAAADPVGVARFLRGHAELRAIAGTTPVAVLANRLRPGALGVDARGQVRRTLERFGGVRDVWFVPHDARSTDAALLVAEPIAGVAPRSPLVHAVRRFVGEAVVPAPSASRGQGRSAHRAA